MLSNRIKSAQKRMIANTSRTYRIFSVLFVCLMLVFSTSKLWLPSDAKVQNTEIGTEKEVSPAVKLRLRSWKYNHADGFMEIAFDVKNSDSSQIVFLPVAHTNRAKTTALKTGVAYNNDGLLIVHIASVPRNWDVLSLWIKTSVNADSAGDATGTGNDNGANFLCDSRKVIVDDTLKSSSRLIYALQSIDNQITQVNSDSATVKKEIEKYDADIKQLEFDISALKANQKYQTPDEVKQTNNTIQNKSSKIQDLKDSTAGCNQKIKIYQEKLKKLKQKRDDTRSGKFTEPAESDLSTSSKASSSSTGKPSKKSFVSKTTPQKNSGVPVIVD